MGGGNEITLNVDVHYQECHDKLHDIKPRNDFLLLHG